MHLENGTPTDQIARTRAYRAGELVAEDFPVANLSDHIAHHDTVVWVDLCAPDTVDLKVVADELGLHELAVEDAVERAQRPKLDHYRTHDFLSMYAVWLNKETGQLETSELAAFLTPRALVTVRKDDRFDVQRVVNRWDATPELARHEVGFLVYGLIDFVVDGHFETVQDLDEEIEKLEDLLFDEKAPNTEVQRRSFELRKSLVRLRKIVLPMREVVNTLMRRDVPAIAHEMIPYFQDVYDHVLRATEWTESLRDLVTTILETNLTIQGNRLNVISKQVTSWAAIIAVPTAITGFYGQNVPYPGFNTEHGFITSTALIVFLSGLLYIVFRRKGWL
jgi:magnesium transporter